MSDENPIAAEGWATRLRARIENEDTVWSDAFDRAEARHVASLLDQLRTQVTEKSDQGWSIPAQPGRHVTVVRGRWGGLWRRAATDQHGFAWRDGDRWKFADRYLTWGELLAGWGPLTDATDDRTT